MRPRVGSYLGSLSRTEIDMHLSAKNLDKMIEEATVDCYDELEQSSGFYR